MKKRIAAVLGTIGATTLLLLVFAAPSQAGTLHDPSAAGDGGWKPFADIVPENRKIRLESWEYRSDNLANYVVCTGLSSSADRHASCTNPVD